jgi:thiamine biosynthesis lipoprotein
VFDTQTEITGYAASEEEFNEQVGLLMDKLTFYHQLFDIYHDYDGINNLKTINDNAGIAPVVVDEEIIRLLTLAQSMAEETDGMVNVALGSVLSCWHDYREEGLARLPDAQELEEANRHTDISRLIIDEAGSTVYLADADMSLDVGSIGKGYAVQKTAEYAAELGIEHLLINVGGNVCAVGTKPDGSDWKVGITNPDTDSSEPYIQKVSVSNRCVVTSGNYQRYYTVDGVRYCHIINPDTLMPSTLFSSVSIIADDSSLADALSTAVFNMNLDNGLSLINGLDGVEAMWITVDGDMIYSEGFEQYLAD